MFVCLESTEAVDQWFKPVSPVTNEFFRAINQSEGRVPKLTQSARTLRREIRSATGAPPRFWVALQRARQAALEIINTDKSLVDLALEAGYSDQPHLIREIRLRFGATPLALRRKADRFRSIINSPDAFSFFGCSNNDIKDIPHRASGDWAKK